MVAIFTIAILLIAVYVGGIGAVDIVLPYDCDDIDVMFVVDGSGSVREENFEKVKEWLVTSVASIHDALGSRVQIGVIEFARKDKFVIGFHLGNCSTVECMTTNIRNMSYIGSGTDTAHALRYTLEVEFPRSSRYNSSRKLIILVTDGQANDRTDLPDWSREAISRNITTFAVGVGKYKIEELRIVANREENIFTVTNFEALPQVVARMAGAFCVDNDECELKAHNCSVNTTCRNLPGNFSCECKEGYFRNGDYDCADIDECQVGVCEQKLCVNTAGSYRCYCDDGYLEEDSSCSECNCEKKDGYNEPTSQCPGADFFCEYNPTDGKETKTCRVPKTSAFAALFNEIEEWRRKADQLTNASQVIDKINAIDEKIKCAAAATSGSKKTAGKRPGTEVASMRISANDVNEEPVISFSYSNLQKIFANGLDTGQGVYVEFAAPKITIDLLLKQPEKLSSISTLNTQDIYTEKSPIFSVSVFEAPNVTYRRDTKLEFEIDVTKDFSNVSFPTDIVYEPAFWSGYISHVGYKCKHIDTVTGLLSDEGCEAKDYVIGSKVTCKCDHTTMFAVLLTYTRVEIPPSLKILSYVIESISVIFLILTTVILLNVKPQIRGDRIVVQICLSISLLVLHSFNLLHDLALRNERTCEVITVIIHYFLLASAMWMLMEGLTLVVKTSDHTLKLLSEENKRDFVIFRQFVSWGVPLLIVLISAILGFINGNYMDKNPAYIEQISRPRLWDLELPRMYSFCWVGQIVLLWAVIVPMGVILFLNLIIMIRMAFYIHKMSSEAQQFKPTHEASKSKATTNHTLVAFKATIVLLPVLGISWILAFLTNIDDRHSSLIFLYINVILNGLQGIFLFIVYCVIGREVRRAVQTKYQRSQHIRESSRKSSHSKTGLKMAQGPRRKRAKESGKTKSTALPHSHGYYNNENHL